MSGTETTQSLAAHLRHMADNAGDQIDTDRLLRAADLVEAPQAVRVKPLVWRPLGDIFTAFDPIFETQVITDDCARYDAERSSRILGALCL